MPNLLEMLDKVTVLYHKAQNTVISGFSGTLGKDQATLRKQVDEMRLAAGLPPSPVELTPSEELWAEDTVEIRADIIRGMGRAFFACGWADQHDNGYDEAKERGEEDAFVEKYGSLSGKDIMDVMPKEIDPAAVRLAARVLADLERINDTTVEAIYEDYPGPGTPELWGHYLAMEAMGQGVGLSTDYEVPKEAIRLPFPAFYESILDKDYFSEEPHA